MACEVKFISSDGKEFTLGKFNEGKRTETQIVSAAAKKYHNLVKRLELPGHIFRITRPHGNIDVPVEQLKKYL